MTEYKSPDEVPEATKKSLVPSMFPPTDEEKQTFHLERWFVHFRIPYLCFVRSDLVSKFVMVRPFGSVISVFARGNFFD